MKRYFCFTEDYVLTYWEKDVSVSVLPSDKVTGDMKGFSASCHVLAAHWITLSSQKLQNFGGCCFVAGFIPTSEPSQYS